jgi:hypothetical protein
MVRQRLRRRKVHPDRGLRWNGLAKRKCPWKKLQKSLVIHLCFTKGRSNSSNILAKFYLNHGLQEPDIYIANIPAMSNMTRYNLMKIYYPADPPQNYLQTTGW